MKKLCIGLIMALLVMPGVATSGETNESDDTLIIDDVVVTATRLEQQNEKIPAQVTVITAEDIKASGAQSVPEALKHLGGINISPDLNGNSFNDQIDMGGFGETANRHVAVVIDGRKINPIDQSSISFISIPIENIEKIEVLYGGNSVLYGGDAMGGVINIITQKAKEGIHVSGEAGIGSYDTLKANAGVSFVKGRFSGNANVVHYETDGYRDRSETDRQSADVKFSFAASDSLNFSLQASTTQADYQMPGSLSKAEMDDDREQAKNLEDEGESQDDYFVFSFSSDWVNWGKLDINLSYREYERQDNLVSWNFPSWGYYGYYDYDCETIGVNPQYVLDRSIFGKDNRLTLGIEFYDIDYDAGNGDSATKSIVNTYDHDQTLAGFYAQNEFNLTEQLVFNLGGRYEDFDTTLKSSLGTNTGVNENEWAWNAGLAYIFAPGTKLYTRAYQAYRFPKVDEYMILSTGAVNEDLKHETSKGYEIGARFVGLDKKLSANIRFYTFNVDDEISWNSVVYQNENLDETRHRGVDLDAKFQVNRMLSLFGGFGYTDAEFTSGANDGKSIPLVPEIKGNIGFALKFDFGLTYRCQFNHLGSRYSGGDYDNSTYEKLEDANTVDMYVTYTYKNAEFFLNAKNIFNEEYASSYYGSYYPMPEAVYYGGVRFKF